MGLCGVMGPPGSGFMSMQGGELFLTNSFVSKVQAKFIKSIGAQRQAPQTSTTLSPRPTPVARGRRSSAPSDLLTLHFGSGGGATLDDMITPNFSPKWRNDSKEVK